MAKYTKLGYLGYCSFCGIRMKIAESINNRIDISRLFVCKNPGCGKETYWTKEIHLARFARYEEFEKRQLEAVAAAHPNTVAPDIIPRAPIFPATPPVIEHSYERALTPVEPPTPHQPPPMSPEQEAAFKVQLDDMMQKLVPVEDSPLQLTPSEIMQKRRGRRYDALRAEGLSQDEAGRKVDAETDEEVSTWDAETEFAKNVAQNQKRNALEKKLKKQFKNGEITIEEHDRQLRELDES